MEMNYLDELAARIRSQVPPEKFPELYSDELFRIYAVLALVKGSAVTAEDVHDAWSAWMAGIDPNHESMTPFSDLQPSVAADDEFYVKAIRAAAPPTTLQSSASPIDTALFPNGIPTSNEELNRTVDLYKLMVDSSERLVSRRQGVNTFFLTINGGILTAASLVVNSQPGVRAAAIGVVVLGVTGAIFALAWRSLIRSFGQLNKGKFAVINRIEEILPVAVYLAEWKALEEGRSKKTYRTFTSRELWVPWTFFMIYTGAAAVASFVTVAHLWF